MKAPKTPPIVFRTSFTQKLAFTAKPSPAVRKALRDSGWRWNGLMWFRNVNSTVTIDGNKLDELFIPITADAGEVAAN